MDWPQAVSVQERFYDFPCPRPAPTLRSYLLSLTTHSDDCISLSMIVPKYEAILQRLSRSPRMPRKASDLQQFLLSCFLPDTSRQPSPMDWRSSVLIPEIPSWCSDRNPAP